MMNHLLYRFNKLDRGGNKGLINSDLSSVSEDRSFDETLLKFQ